MQRHIRETRNCYLIARLKLIKTSSTKIYTAVYEAFYAKNARWEKKRSYLYIHICSRVRARAREGGTNHDVEKSALSHDLTMSKANQYPPGRTFDFLKSNHYLTLLYVHFPAVQA